MACDRIANSAAKSACQSGGVSPQASKTAAVAGRAQRRKRAATAIVAGAGAVAVGVVAARNLPKAGNFALGVAVKQDRRANQLYRQAADLVAQTLTNGGSDRLKSLKEAERLAQKSISQFQSAGQAAHVAARLQKTRPGGLARTRRGYRTAKGVIRTQILLGLIRQSQAKLC
jgi:hypothetical protein